MRTEARFPRVGAAAGHYESFYLKLGDPAGGRAAWLRHTVHKRPREPPTCALWLTVFDAGGGAPLGLKQQFGAAALGVPDGAYVAVGDATLGDGIAEGRLRAAGGGAGWSLRFSDPHPPFRHLPYRFLYRTPLPRTKLLSPYPNAVFTGRLDVDGEALDVDGWHGIVGHNWGAEHAEQWVWIHAGGLDGGAPDDYVDIAAGRLRVGGRTTPWLANGMLLLDGAEHRVGGLRGARGTRLDARATSCALDLRGAGVRVTGRVSAAPAQVVAWRYADPAGPEHHALNCSIADLELEVVPDHGPRRRLAARGTAVYELGTRDPGHGIPLQPFADG